MNFDPRRTCLELLLAGSFGSWLPTALHAETTGRFAYKWVMLREQDQVDPAVERRTTPQAVACSKRAKVTYEIADCEEAEFRRQDAILNRTWRIVLKRLPSAWHPQLLIAQREWIAKRDPACRALVDDQQLGTIAPIAYSSCRREQTVRRTIWLENLR